MLFPSDPMFSINCFDYFVLINNMPSFYFYFLYSPLAAIFAILLFLITYYYNDG